MSQIINIDNIIEIDSIKKRHQKLFEEKFQTTTTKIDGIFEDTFELKLTNYFKNNNLKYQDINYKNIKKILSTINMYNGTFYQKIARIPLPLSNA